MAHTTTTDWRSRDVIGVPEACEVLGLSRPSVYAAIKNGEIASFRLGGRVLIPTSAIKALVDQPAA